MIGESCGGGLACIADSPGCGGRATRCPKFGFCILQSATSFGSICGKGLLARGRCGVPRTIGMTQSIKRPLPALASPRTKPACSQDAMISIQAGWRGAACTEPHVIEATTRIPRAVLLPRILSPCDACFLYSAIERQQPSNASQTRIGFHAEQQ